MKEEEASLLAVAEMGMEDKRDFFFFCHSELVT
jgi:hypothetical protein